VHVLVVLPLLLAGCDQLFELVRIDEEPPVDARDSVQDARAIDAAPDTIIQTHSNCPAGFAQPYENSTYRYITTPLAWSDAMRYCSSLDDPTSTKRVHLAVLSNDFERSSHVYVTVVGSASSFWIGLSDTKLEGAFEWVTAEAVGYPYPAAWGPSEPSADAPSDDCVRVEYSNNDLDTVLCSTPAAFVCECDDFALAPAKYELN
jgi:hypothetical protein